jgi:hypothetical protein
MTQPRLRTYHKKNSNSTNDQRCGVVVIGAGVFAVATGLRHDQGLAELGLQKSGQIGFA